METASDSNSIKSVGTSTSLKTPNSLSPTTSFGKKVGFAIYRTRPKLIIPPPTPQLSQGVKVQYTAGTPGISRPTPNNHIDIRKESVFNFNQHLHDIKYYTKSGLGIGEKCAFWLINKLKTLSRKWFTHMFLSIVLIIYTIGGALIFEYIEGDYENVNEVDLRTIRKEFIKNFSNLTTIPPGDTTLEEREGMAVRLIKEYEKTIVKWQEVNRLISKGKKWSFWNAIVFCGTVYTTIGYGHIYPETMTGKALTIVYAIIGIPLFLLALADFGKLFTRCIKFLWSFVRRVYYTGSCRKVRKTAHVEEIFKGAQMMYDIATFRRPSMFPDPENPEDPSTAQTQIGDDTPTTPAISNFEIDDEFNLPISLAIFILVLYIFLGGLIYSIWEGWAFFDSFYFVFISMSTIGFGDIVPDSPACMIVSIVYLVFGLALMSMCIDVVQAKLSDTFKQASTKIGATIGISVDEDEMSNKTAPTEDAEVGSVHDSKSLESSTPNDTLEKRIES